MSRPALLNELVDAGLITRDTAVALQADSSLVLVSQGDQGAAVASVAGTAGGTYTATEQDVINDTATAVNGLLVELRSLGLIAT